MFSTTSLIFQDSQDNAKESCFKVKVHHSGERDPPED